MGPRAPPGVRHEPVRHRHGAGGVHDRVGGRRLARGRLSDRVARPLGLYGLLEATIGVYALFFPSVVRILEPLYLAFWHATDPSPLAFGGFQFLLLGPALLIPTACMGATLPLLVRHVAPKPSEAGAVVGRLYGINTAGAVVGVAAAGFWLLPDLGVRDTTLLVACGNFMLCGIAFWMDRQRIRTMNHPSWHSTPLPLPPSSAVRPSPSAPCRAACDPFQPLARGCAAGPA